MTFTVSPWLVWAGTCLVLFGAVWLARGMWREVRGAAGWLADWLRGRIDPPWWWKPWLYRRAEKYDAEDDRIIAGKCEACWAENDGEGCDWAMCGCACHDDDGLPPLPPERSWEQMTTERTFWGEHYGQPGEPGGEHWGPPGSPSYLAEMARLSPSRERRAPKWEAEARGHYAAMGLDYPSGLMARVRELTP